MTPEEKKPPEESGPSYTPASFEKRAAAWVGIVYMVIVAVVMAWTTARGGQVLTGTGPLLLLPAAGGVAAVAIHRRRTGAAGTAFTVLVLLVAAAGAVLGLALGLPPLLGHPGV